MQRHHEFLEFTPAYQASAALLLSINMSYSPVSELIGLPRLGEKFSAPHEFEKEEQLWVIHDESDIQELNTDFNFKSDQHEDPLSTWSKRMSNTTNISARKELAPVYEQLITLLDKEQFKGKLATDSKLWLPDNYFRSEFYKML